MIGYLRGTALSENLLDVGGVGYLVHTSSPLATGQAVELRVTTVVRDDAIVLYGFPTSVEQDLFAAVVKVPGVGPASALSMLATLGVEGLVSAIAGKDAKAIAGVKGVGAKTAEKVVGFCVLPDGVAAAATDPRVTEMAITLIGLGYDKATARAAAEQAVIAHPAGSDETLLSAALAFGQEVRA